MTPDREIFKLPVHHIDDIEARVEREDGQYRVKTWNKRWRDLETTIAYYEKIVECLKEFKEEKK